MRASASSARINAIRRRLLACFDRHRRDLPWRRTHNPYRIWLAEIMLQQTRVPVVIPYYRRFLRAFPTVSKLARARLGRVLRLWAGLGYYQRARHLHQAAKQIVRQHRGRFPARLPDALALPGIGPYTARAILSIAYQEPLAVVDGNVARVLVRLFRLAEANVNDRSRLQPLADCLVSPRRPGDFNQALMELGSTICLPRIPRCSLCPLETVCAARQAGVERQIPARRAPRQRPRIKLNVLIVHRRGRVLLAREAKGLFSGLWHFPYGQGDVRRLARRLGARQPKRLATLQHQTTMRELVLEVYEAEAGRDGCRELPPTSRWVTPRRVVELGVGAAIRKIAAQLG